MAERSWLFFLLLRRSLHFFSYEFSGCFLGDDDILTDGIVSYLEGDGFNNRLSLGSREILRDMMVRDRSSNKIYQIGMKKIDTTVK